MVHWADTPPYEQIDFPGDMRLRGPPLDGFWFIHLLLKTARCGEGEIPQIDCLSTDQYVGIGPSGHLICPPTPRPYINQTGSNVTFYKYLQISQGHD